MPELKNKQNILLITRKYPPSKGGMQTFAFNLFRNLSKTANMRLLAWNKSNLLLPYFILKVLIYLLFNSKTLKLDLILIYDSALSPLGFVLKKLLGKKVVVIANGLDVTYSNAMYQKIIKKYLPQLDGVICISRSTMEIINSKGIPSDKCIAIPIGIDSNKQVHIPIKKTLVTVGRLVKRKGHAWFVKNVMTQLPDDYHYLIAGTGPELGNISKAIANHNLQDKVSLLGEVSESKKNKLLSTASVMVIPNIHVEGDMEGFGIVALEASSRGLPVIASNLEGIRDAVVDNETGYLVASEDAKAFCGKIIEVCTNGKLRTSRTIRMNTRKYFGWKKIISRYLNFVNNL